MTDKELWLESGLDGEFDSFSFYDDFLLDLVMNKTKMGTSSLYDMYQYLNEELPKENSYSVILDSSDNAKCIIKNKSVNILPFNKVDDRLAYLEGEGDKSLEYWKNTHREFFANELKEINKEFNEDMLIVFEEFELVYLK